jgi:hypothetical protein
MIETPELIDDEGPMLAEEAWDALSEAEQIMEAVKLSFIGSATKHTTADVIAVTRLVLERAPHFKVLNDDRQLKKDH